MLNHAFRRNMSHAILLTGDQDFKPVVQSLVDMGLMVTVAGDHRHMSSDLARAADYYRPITLTEYFDWTVQSLKNKFPIPVKGYTHENPKFAISDLSLVKKGTIAGIPSELYRKGNEFWVVYEENERLWLEIRFNDVDRLSLFCEIELGEVLFPEQASTIEG